MYGVPGSGELKRPGLAEQEKFATVPDLVASIVPVEAYSRPRVTSYCEHLTGCGGPGRVPVTAKIFEVAQERVGYPRLISWIAGRTIAPT